MTRRLNSARTATIVCALALMPALAVPALALDGGAWVSAGVESVSYEFENTDDPEITGAMGVVRAGYDFGRYFGVEGEVGFGSPSARTEGVFRSFEADGTVRNLRFQADQSVDNHWVLAVRGRVPIGSRAEAFIRLGGGNIGTSAEFETVDVDTGERVQSGDTDREDTVVMLGLGGQYMFGATRSHGVRLDLSAYVDPDTENGLGTASVAYVYRFLRSSGACVREARGASFPLACKVAKGRA